MPAASAGKAQARSDTWRFGTCGLERLQKGEFLLMSARTDEKVAVLMTRSIWRGLGLKGCCQNSGCDCVRRELVVTSLITRVEADHLGGCTDLVAMVSLAHKVTLQVVRGPGICIGRARSCWVILLLAWVLS